MAALIRHGLLVNPLKSLSTILSVNTTSLRHDIIRFKSKKKTPPIVHKLESRTRSLTARGFLRYQKEYLPAEDVSDRINKICKQQQVSTTNETKLEDLSQRFKIFLACEEEFQHPIMNSMLYSIETIGDLKKYYQTPVSNVTPLDAMQSMELPKNLHIEYDYLRFHPDTDTLFNGKTAFPKSSTFVTGLKYKKKYFGHNEDTPFLKKMLKDLKDV